MLSFFNSLLTIHIAHNQHVKRIAYNAVTDEVLIISETGVHANDYILMKHLESQRTKMWYSLLNLHEGCCRTIILENILCNRVLG